MPKNTMLYHKESAPDGEVFDLEKVAESALVEQGWVDNPGKFGHNIWGGPDAAMEPIKRAFESKEVGAIESVAAHTPSNEMDALRTNNSQLHEHLRVRDDENVALRRQLKESQEKLADHRSDAARIEETNPTTQVPVAGDTQDAGAAAGADPDPAAPDPTDI